MTAAPDLFGPYPASPQEREGRVRAVFGDAGPFRVVQMRAVRHKCPGCSSSIGSQCTQGRAGGRRTSRRICHPSRVAVTHPCPRHAVRAGVPCPGETPICEERERVAKADLDILAAGIVAASARKAEQDRAAAAVAADYIRTHLTALDRRG